jgi:hypothetical protein
MKDRTKPRKKDLPLRQPGDTAAMREAVDALTAANHTVRRTSKYQLILDHGFNFWPSTERIHRDGDNEARPERGLQALLRLLAQEARPKVHPKPPEPLPWTAPKPQEPDPRSQEQPDEPDLTIELETEVPW